MRRQWRNGSHHVLYYIEDALGLTKLATAIPSSLLKLLIFTSLGVASWGAVAVAAWMVLRSNFAGP